MRVRGKGRDGNREELVKMGNIIAFSHNTLLGRSAKEIKVYWVIERHQSSEECRHRGIWV